MKYISLFSGIEAASVAWEPLGWEPVAFAEVDPFCCELLAKRFPNVPNLGDVSQIDWSPYRGAVDIIVGGSPCQAFSLAGNRKGLMDERGLLMLEYVRAIHDVRPKWLLWENVPGVFSQSNGDAFETLQRELEQCGYSLAWRTLDAQFFGVAQRRRRVFLVGCFGAGGGYPAAVLFEPESLRWDHSSSADKRKALAADADESTGRSYTVITRCGKEGGGKGALVSDDVSLTLSTLNEQTVFAPTYSIQLGQTSAHGSNISDDVAPTLDCASPSAVVCIADDNANAAIDEDLAGTIKVGGGQPFVAYRVPAEGTSRDHSAQEIPKESGANTSTRGR